MARSTGSGWSSWRASTPPTPASCWPRWGPTSSLVEPPGGHPTRGYEPFVDDEAGPERSLWWWHYQTSKRGVVLDLDQADDAELFTRLVRSADIVLEAEPPGRLRRLGLDYEDLVAGAPGLIWVSVTPFGRADPRSTEPVTDLTLLAGGGPVWSCGYDDHSLPPVRGGGNQAFQVGSVWAVTAIEAALIDRGRSGVGQHVDVSLHAAANVTTEAASYSWLVAGLTVQRQTGRHATAGKPTGQTQRLGADGRYVSTGVPPQRQPQFVALLGWLEEHGLLQDFPERVFLEIGAERGIHASEVGDDVVATEILGAGREALMLLASQLPAYEFFIGAQERGIPCGVVYAPEEALADPHFVARGVATPVEHEDLGRTVIQPAAPLVFAGTDRTAQRRAPHLGEHHDDVLGQPDVAPTGGGGTADPISGAPGHVEHRAGDVGRGV